MTKMKGEKNLAIKSLNLFKDKNFRKVFALFIILKIIVIAAAAAGNFLPKDVGIQQKNLDNGFLNAFAQYDSSSYLDISKNGYNREFGGGIGNYSYFPLYPILIYVFSFLFGTGWSAFIVSNILSLFAIMVFYIFIKEEYGNEVASRSSIYLMFFPVFYFFTMMYTESLFFFLIILMFYYAKRSKWGIVGVIGFLATLTRMFGIIMIAPMLYMYLKERNIITLEKFSFTRRYFKESMRNLKKNIKKIDWQIAYFLLIPAALALFYTYFYLTTGNFFIAFEVFGNQYYNFKPLFPGVSFLHAAADLIKWPGLDLAFYLSLNLLLGALFLLATIYSFRLNPTYGVFMLPYYILSIAHTTVNANIRYYMLMFPAYILLAKVKGDKFKKMMFIIMAASFFLMVLFTIRHVNTHVDFMGVADYLSSMISIR